ncbi:hypothetical protein Zmor_016934 [Zophobas morio]|uniref:Uncharacterized protein n=1 Tax=Zophobas morio TaxID=2755281 RepID=A0AA38MC45_9CUCU|nr:hypothetical protein Zmor_016934 [Zophobas morio]
MGEGSSVGVFFMALTLFAEFGAVWCCEASSWHRSRPELARARPTRRAGAPRRASGRHPRAERVRECGADRASPSIVVFADAQRFGTASAVDATLGACL